MYYFNILFNSNVDEPSNLFIFKKKKIGYIYIVSYLNDIIDINKKLNNINSNFIKNYKEIKIRIENKIENTNFSIDINNYNIKDFLYESKDILKNNKLTINNIEYIFNNIFKVSTNSSSEPKNIINKNNEKEEFNINLTNLTTFTNESESSSISNGTDESNSKKINKCLNKKKELQNTINKEKILLEKLIEKKNIFDSDKKIFFLLLEKKKEEKDNFVIPFFFQNKFNIFYKLYLDDNLTWDKYLDNEPEAITFDSSKYADIFIQNNNLNKNIYTKKTTETSDTDIPTSDIEISD